MQITSTQPQSHRVSWWWMELDKHTYKKWLTDRTAEERASALFIVAHEKKNEIEMSRFIRCNWLSQTDRDRQD